MVFHISKVHFSYAVKQFNKFFVTLTDSSPKLIAVYIVIIKQSGKIIFSFTTLCRFFNVTENPFQSFVKIFIICRICTNITKKFARQNEETFFLYKPVTGFFCLFIRHFRIVKVGVSRIGFTIVYIIA